MYDTTSPHSITKDTGGCCLDEVHAWSSRLLYCTLQRGRLHSSTGCERLAAKQRSNTTTNDNDNITSGPKSLQSFIFDAGASPTKGLVRLVADRAAEASDGDRARGRRHLRVPGVAFPPTAAAAASVRPRDDEAPGPKADTTTVDGPLQTEKSVAPRTQHRLEITALLRRRSIASFACVTLAWLFRSAAQ